MTNVTPLTEREETVYHALAGAADRGEGCPTGEAIRDLLGAQTASASSKILARIERKGWIRVESFARGRRVTILRTGKATRDPGNTAPHWRQTKEAARSPITCHVLEGRAPAPGFPRVVEDYGALAADMQGEAFRLGRTIPDFLSYLVGIGWRSYVAQKAQAGASAGLV